MSIPQSLPNGAPLRWCAEQQEILRSDWGEAWTAQADDLAQEVLSATLASRPEDAILDLMFWSPEVLLPARVSVRMGKAASAAVWERHGYEVDAYNSPTLGPGLQCISQRDLPDGNSSRAVTEAAYIFTDEDESVVLTAGPTATAVYVLMTPGLQNILTTLEVRHESGHRFAAQPVTGYSIPDAEPWVMETGTVRG